MLVAFEKWHGCKNDFIVIHRQRADDQVFFDAIRRSAPHLCSRAGDSIGADGILILDPADPNTPTEAQWSMHIINADGSLADNCGNGLRCAAGSIRRSHRKAGLGEDRLPEIIEVAVGKRLMNCQLLWDREGEKLDVAVEIGIPETAVDEEIEREIKAICFELGIADSVDDISYCLLGNQHVTLFMSKHLSHADFERIGRRFQLSDKWQGINLHLAESAEVDEECRRKASQVLKQPIEELFIVRPWERGVGPTQACGSGACAVAVGAFASGCTSRAQWLGIEMPGGILYVEQTEEGAPVRLAGPAVLAFTGQVHI